MTHLQPRRTHNDYATPTPHSAKTAAEIAPACDYRDRFTEPPHGVADVKRTGRAPRPPILDPAMVTPGTSEPAHPRRRLAPVAQWIEQAPSKRLAAGSSPAGGTTQMGTVFSSPCRRPHGVTSDLGDPVDRVTRQRHTASDLIGSLGVVRLDPEGFENSAARGVWDGGNLTCTSGQSIDEGRALPHGCLPCVSSISAFLVALKQIAPRLVLGLAAAVASLTRHGQGGLAGERAVRRRHTNGPLGCGQGPGRACHPGRAPQ